MASIVLDSGITICDYEQEIAKYCIEKNIPLLGICCGCINMALATGGSISLENYDYLKELPYKVVLVTFYTDKFVLIDIKHRSPQEITEKVCKRQTVFNDHRMVPKKVVKWFVKDLKLLDYD